METVPIELWLITECDRNVANLSFLSVWDAGVVKRVLTLATLKTEGCLQSNSRASSTSEPMRSDGI